MSMQPRSYYRIITDPQNNIATEDTGLQVNCTGYSVYGEQDRVFADTVRQDYYLILLKEGTVSVSRPCLSRALQSGDLFLFAPNQPFAYTKPLGEKMVYYWVHFTGKDAAFLLDRCGLAPNTILTPDFRQDFQEQFLRLFDAFSLRDHLFDLYAAQILSLLLIALGRATASNVSGSAKNRSGQAFVHSISYIHSHLSQPIGVKQLADMEFLSVSRYRALFRERIGISPQEYVIFTKLNHACQLLKNTQMPVSEISLSIGYEDAQYFSRLFTKHIGISPSRYRRQRDPFTDSAAAVLS